MSYFVNCSAEKAVRYDREQVEKDGTEFSHLHHEATDTSLTRKCSSTRFSDRPRRHMNMAATR
jgi:hypothetical protein